MHLFVAIRCESEMVKGGTEKFGKGKSAYTFFLTLKSFDTLNITVVCSIYDFLCMRNREIWETKVRIHIFFLPVKNFDTPKISRLYDFLLPVQDRRVPGTGTGSQG